jgi:hypothetical protein
MWVYDINKEKWNSESSSSLVVPSPRSDFAHARYQNNFIIFGGAGDTELFNDIYIYNAADREWKSITVATSPYPSPRKAACMAVSDDFILIYGGIDSTGYNNELWKFDWSTQRYTLFDSSNSTPKVAFSQSHIESNSDNQLIFKVYLGETEGGGQHAYIYEYNLATNRWSSIYDIGVNYNIGRTRAAIFMINDAIITAGGSAWYSFSDDRISIHRTPLDKNDDNIVEYLPDYTYSAGSVYYKNKIYIHGGGYSFGDLSLSNMVKMI